MTDIYFWRQCLSLLAGLMYSLSTGFTLAFPSVLNLAITSANSTDTDIHTTQDHATWIAAANGFGGILGAFILSPIMDIFGRKTVLCAIDTFIGIGWIIIIFAKDVVTLYVARFIQGISVSNLYIMCIIMSEYVHPSRRGYFITFKKITVSVGVLLCHAMSVIWTWRQIAIFAVVPPVIGIMITICLPESPSYLAVSGKFDQCEKSFKWMMGDSVECQRELNILIETYRRRNGRNMIRKYKLGQLLKTFLMKDFQKEFLISSMLSLALELCGRYFVVAYAIQIMKSLVISHTSALYFTLGADLFILIALCFSTVVVKQFNRRTVLFSSGISAVTLMFLISAMVYANTLYSFSKAFLWLTAIVLISQCFIVNLGLIPVSFVLVGEIFKLEHKGLAICLSDLVFTFLNALFLKLTPIMMEGIGLHGVYGIFGAILAVCLTVLYKTVPETKDKTLQEIENELNCGINKEIRESVFLMR